MIRPARPEDAAQIAEIWNRVIRETTITFLPDEKSPDDVAALMDGTFPFLVWEEAGRVMGFARAFPFRGGAGYRHTAEHTILLRDGAAGRGGGAALMAALVEALRAQGIHTLWAGISAENSRGVVFHTRHGFEHVARLGEVGRKFDRWIDLILMRKLLDPGPER